MTLGVLIPILGLLIGGFVIFSKSDLGRALAQRIAGQASANPALEAQLEEIRAEVSALRAELSETQERLDFTERLIAQQRSPEGIAPGSALDRPPPLPPH